MGKKPWFPTKSRKRLAIWLLMQKIATTAHHETTGSAKETDAANKTSFLAKRNHLLPFKQAVETEQIKI